MFTIMGATGHTGSRIADLLLADGRKVRALGRSESRLADLRRRGAETMTGDAADSGFLTKAFRGADAVYTLLPTDRQAPDYRDQQDRQGQAIAEAVRRSGVRFVVALSSLGADVASKTGLIAGLHAQEGRLRDLEGVHVCLLRPASFFENFEAALEMIRQAGYHADALAPDRAIPMVAARDIADAAVRALTAPDRNRDGILELLGPRDLTPVEATRLLGRRLGRPDLRYVQFSYADMADALIQAGMSGSFAALYGEMARAINDGRIKPRDGRTAENTTPTRFEDYAQELARAHQEA